MKLGDVFPGKYLQAADAEAGPLLLTIAAVQMETMKDKDDMDVTKPVAYFEEVEKGLVVNKTNWQSIEALAKEPDSDFWAGTVIMLENEMVTAFGKTAPALRVKDPSGFLKQMYWGLVLDKNMNRKDGEAFLAENSGDFAKALAALKAK